MPYFDYGILGAGLAGLSLADALQKENQQVIVIEQNEPGAGASGTPGAMVNPATGRKGKKSWRAEDCYHAIQANLQKIQTFASQPFNRRNGVLRPAQDEKMARKMKDTFEQTNWPESWCYWLTEEEIKEKHPGIHCVDGGLWLPIVMTVDGGQYMRAYAKWLQQNGVAIKTNVRTAVKKSNDHWLIHTSNQTITCKNLIYATGYGTLSSSYWNDLPLEPIKGQLAIFKTKKPLSFNHSVSGLGYVANVSDIHPQGRSSGNTHIFVQGSTYEHHFDNLKTDRDAYDYLMNRLKKMLPALPSQSTLLDQWSGIRMSSPNRKPVVGAHPTHKNLYLFTGFGSKGLLYSAFVAKCLADYLLNQAPLFKEISLSRLT